MSKKMREEFQGKALKSESSPKVTGAVFVGLAVLVFILGLMVHWIQTGGLPNDAIVDVLIGQLHFKFAVDFFVGFFTGIFLVAGIYYLKQKPEAVKVEEAPIHAT